MRTLSGLNKPILQPAKKVEFMLTIPYDATRTSLLKPGEAKDFFLKYDQVKNNSAALCAEMARLAYVTDVNQLKTYLTDGGFNLVLAIGYQNKGTQLFIAQADNKTTHKPLVIIAFRGTESNDPTDLVSDARLLKTKWTDDSNHFCGNVHQGFAEALPQAIIDQIIDVLNKIEAPQILITGHSLGAALATLLAAYLIPTAFAKDMHLYTFGSPLVGDKDFATNMKYVEHARYVNCCDLVTRIPPELLGYAHADSLRYIDREGHLHKSIGEDEIAQDRQTASLDYLYKYTFLNGTAPVRELADHAPINYVSGVAGLRP